METNKWEIRLAIITGLFFTANSLGTCVMVGLGNSIWSQMTSQSKFVMCVGIFVNWSGTMIAWMNRAISDLRRGRFPFPPGSSSDTSLLTKKDIPQTPTAMKAAIGLATIGWLILIFGCSNFSNNMFRSEQTLTGVALTAYVGYTNALANGTLKPSVDESNAVKTARIKFAAAVLTAEQWRLAYETNSAVKPQAQAALDALVSDSSNVVALINLLKSK